jgi:drug/metabolite transporter (DMT)-like permease
MQPRTLAHIAVLAVTFIYAGGFSISKIIMPSLIQPRGFILLRVVVGAILFWLFFLLKGKDKTKIDRKDFPRLILCGLFGVATNQLFFFEGLARTTPIHAALMMLTTPILVGIMASFVLKEKFTFLKIAGIGIGLTGATMLICKGDFTKLGNMSGLGDFFVFLNAASYAIYLIAVKPLMAKYSPLAVIRWVFLFGALMVIPFGLGQVSDINWSLFELNDYWVLGYVLIAMTFLAYLWNVFAMKQLSPTVIGSYIYLQPFLASIIAILFFGEIMTWNIAQAGVLIFSGVYMVSIKKKVGQ